MVYTYNYLSLPDGYILTSTHKAGDYDECLAYLGLRYLIDYFRQK